MIETYNKKRLLITILSVSIMILIFIICAFLIYFLIKKQEILLASLTLTAAIFALYFESRLLIKPLYNKLKCEIIKDIVKGKGYKCDIKVAKEKFSFLKNYYDVKGLTIDSNIMLDFSSFSIVYATFNITNKVNKAYKTLENGILYKIIYKNTTLNDATYIKNNNKESEQFIKFNKDLFKNINNDLTTLSSYKSYTVLYNDNYDYNLINLFDHYNDFNFINVLNNTIYALVLENQYASEFRLENKLTNNDLVDIKNSLNGLFKLIDNMKG